MSKVHTLKCAAYNLGLLLRKVWGFCKPRNAEAAGVLFLALLLLVIGIALVIGQHTHETIRLWLSGCGLLVATLMTAHQFHRTTRSRKKQHSLTGC